jgi:hypothetical protein
MTTVRFDDFTLAYLEAALWSTNDNADETGGQPLDQNYSIEDIDFASLARLLEDCAQFQQAPAWRAALEAEAWNRPTGEHSPEAQGGHDFWLTQNGHGAGFWDGDWTEPHGEALTQLSKRFGGRDLYIGDGGKIYC